MPELVRAVRPTRDWAAYRKLRRRIREFRPDVVHTHSSKAGIVGREAAWRERVPAVVHTIHGMPFGRFESARNNAVYRVAERWAARRCHAIVSVCDAMTEQSLAAGVGRADQYLTIYSGMDVDAFLNPRRPRAEVRAELGLADDQVGFGTVARLFELKGHDDVLDAAPAVLRSNPQVRFVFIGDGTWRDRLRVKAEALGVAHAVRFHGLVPPAAIPELINALDVVVHPSLREGLARVLPQALIVGRPVISYDIDGAREVVRPDTGILLPTRSVEGLTEAILRLAADPGLRSAMGQAGRERFADRFREQVMASRLRALYGRLLNGGPVTEGDEGR
jgi:glycosyltransferase involved in cell wall biosynthesis